MSLSYAPSIPSGHSSPAAPLQGSLPGLLGECLAEAASRRIEAKEFVFMEGDPTTNVYWIESGAVSLSKMLPDGRRQILGFAYAGDLVGLGAQGERLVSAQAIKAARVRSIPVARLHKIAANDPAFSFKLYQTLAAELADARDLMLTTGHRSACERVAAFLLTLSRRNRRGGKDRAVIDLPMTRADIGDFLGLTIETVSRTLTKFKSRGLIDLPQSARVHLADMIGLERIAAGEEH
jgi:CRP/FNR family transcriptional regulator, anaerobic regulatory protein